MRQCILLYVLLLLFYPWVMPDTRMYESGSSILFCVKVGRRFLLQQSILCESEVFSQLFRIDARIRNNRMQ